jgi:dicarboxylate/amino acid:cation (Na+ or H+) symporter, DAACS family
MANAASFSPTPSSGMPLHFKILIGMLSGVLLGFLARTGLGDQSSTLKYLVKEIALPAGQVFMRMIFMVVVPLVISALALGVADIGDIKKMRLIGGKLLGYTVFFTGMAVVVGVSAVNLFQPGVGLPTEARNTLLSALKTEEAATHVTNASHAKSISQQLLEFIPKNPFQEAYNAFEGGLLPLMFFALMIGLALLVLPKEKAKPVQSLLDSVYHVMLTIIHYAMKLAPFCVAALMFSVSATLGLETLLLLAKFVAVVLGALAFQQFIVYGLAVSLLAKRNPFNFFKQLQEVMFTAFSTSSSSATLPMALETATDKLNLPKQVSHFVLTVGSTLNHHGTALYEGVTVLFLAQFFGVHLTIAQQIPVVLMAILGGIGTAGVPGGSLPMIVVILHSIGVPGEGIGIIIGIDRILDMARTTLNITGDLAIATVISKTTPLELSEASEEMVPSNA